MGSLKLTTASSGSVILSPANTASDVTITVPAVTGTMLTNKTAGTVLQVVNALYSTTINTTSGTYSDTGLTVTITPSSTSSKILVLAHVNGIYVTSNTTAVNSRIVRNSTAIATIDTIGGYITTGPSGVGGASASYLDSPSTTSATVYKVQYASSSGGQVYLNGSAGGQTSSYITVMEIAG